MSKIEQEREMNRKILHDKVCNFEEIHGSSTMSKIMFNTLSRLIVEKGIASEREIINYFQREIDIYEAKNDTK